MATVNSASAAYATGSDLVTSRDYRQVGDFLKDDNTRPATSGDVAGDAIVGVALKWASGQVEAAATVGQRYAHGELTALAGSGTVGGELLKGLVCDLAFWYLAKRRKPSLRQDDVAGVPEAYELLDRLRAGERVFPFSETQDAGLADVVALDRADNPVTEAEPLSTRAVRFFGHR